MAKATYALLVGNQLITFEGLRRGHLLAEGLQVDGVFRIIVKASTSELKRPGNYRRAKVTPAGYELEDGPWVYLVPLSEKEESIVANWEVET